MPLSTSITPVILSGGSGTRLWPMSRPERPKQMLALTAEETMLQLTAMRAKGEHFSGPIVVANARHADMVDEQLDHIAPDAAETGYGWIKVGEEIGGGVHRVAHFIEKPPRDKAEAMLAAGDHTW